MMTLSSVYPQASSVTDGRLTVGGCDAVELAREFGTPAYVVAEDDLRARAKEFAEASDATIVYASKAFPCTAALRVFAEEGLSVDVASGGELHLALTAGFDPADIVMHGNAKSHDELRMAVEAGVGLIVIDGSDSQKLDELGVSGQRCLIRIVPSVDVDTHTGIQTGGATSKFGLLPAEAAQLIEQTKQDIAGLHFHLGSQLFSTTPFTDAVRALTTLPKFELYDLGGGLGATYTADQEPPSPRDWVTDVVDIAREHLGDVELMLEPGRALVANAGVTLYSVLDVKRGFVAVDGGMSDNLRPMLYQARYEAILADRAGEPGEAYDVVGKHCESTDVIVRAAELADPRPGDVLVTPVTGAYGHALANNYNGIPRPPVVFCRDGEARVVVRRETYDDLTARDV